jgi:hypothetical protein
VARRVDDPAGLGDLRGDVVRGGRAAQEGIPKPPHELGEARLVKGVEALRWGFEADWRSLGEQWS